MATITEWLASLGLSEYARRFAENDIDFTVLRHLTDQDLKEIGVSLGHRRKILASIAELASAALTRSEPAVPPEPNPRDDAERRQLTVMFTDLVGSTALSTRLDPEDLRSVIGAYHKCVAQTVGRFGGFVARYMGDGVLIYFGYPQAHEDDAERAVRAGLALIEAVGKLGSVEPLQVRIGVGTGLVVVGDLVGSGEAQERGVVGETPNLTARLQAGATPGTIAIDLTTHRLLGCLFEYRDLGGIEAKGFANRVQAYEVVRPSMVESRFEALRMTSTPLIGRDEEVDLLLRRWDQAKRGDGCVVLVAGEPGIGKSRIAETILERLRNEPHTRLRYFCLPHHQHSALYPSITQLERVAGFQRGDTDKQRLDKLEAVLAQGSNDLGEAIPLLAELLSIPTADRYPLLDLTPQKRKEKTLHVQVAQVERLAAQQPVLMVYEDMHWSDPTTRESLDLLIDRVATLRVLVLITFRPEFTPPWVGHPHVTVLNLNRLPPRRRAEMIMQVTGGKALPREIADQIVDRTDGVPLFIEELTKAVIEGGIVTDAGDRYAVAGPVGPLAIPTSLHASLLARLDRLDRLAPTREVAQIGAALGRSFSHELISAVARMQQHQIDDALAQLANAELIFQRGTPPDAEYTFKHALVQDAAYGTLLRSRRQALHARIVATLEAQFPEIVTAQPQLMAQHCTEAGLNEKGIGYWLKAGQQAVARSAMTEAESQLRKGLNLLTLLPPDDPSRWQQELDLQIALGPALIATKGYAAPPVGETYTRARELAQQLDRPNCLGRVLSGQFTFHMIRGEYKLALPFAEQMEMIGKERNDAAVLFSGLLNHAYTRFLLGEITLASTLFERCLGLGDLASPADYTAQTPQDAHVTTLVSLFGPKTAKLRTHAQSAPALTYLGYVDQARARATEAVSEARELGQAFTLAFALVQSCFVTWISRGSPDEAHRHANEMLTLAEEHNFPFYVAWGMIHRGWSLAALGQGQQGITLLRRGLSMVHATGTVAHTSDVFIKLAEAHARLGQRVESLNSLDEAAQIIEALDERYHEAELHRLRGDLTMAKADGAAAEHNYRQALTVAERQGAKLMELRAATNLASLWRDQGKRAEARDFLAPIYRWFTEGLDTPDLKDAKVLLDELT